MEAKSSAKMLVHIYWATQYHIQDDPFNLAIVFSFNDWTQKLFADYNNTITESLMEKHNSYYSHEMILFTQMSLSQKLF